MDAGDRDARARRLVLHGTVLFLLGLVAGFATPAVENPRMGVSAHLEGVMNGTFLLALGAAWRHVALAGRAAAAAYGLVLYGTYVNFASVFFAAVTGASRLMPIAGAGHAAQPWQEAIVAFGLVTISIAITAAACLVLAGLARRPAP
jgi:hydroxylaminobenzene mutase